MRVPSGLLPLQDAPGRGLLGWLFDTSPFVPRWRCGSWSAAEGWLHVASDLVIWAAYTCIPVALAYWLRRRPVWPLRGVLVLFVAFILLCGATHLIDAIIFWQPVYRLAGLAKALTAAVSAATVVALMRNLPLALALRSPRELEAEVSERTAELERAEREALAARDAAEGARRRKEQFLAAFGLEARPPVQAMLRHADALLVALDGQPELRAHALAIARQARHQLALFDDVRMDGAGGADAPLSRPARVPLRPLLQQALELAQHDPAAPLRLEVDGALPERVVVDPVRLRQLVINLAHAAREGAAAGPAPVLTVDWRDREAPGRWLRAGVLAPGLELGDDDLAAVFGVGAEPADPRLVGGARGRAHLRLARRAAEALGGELLVERAPGGGLALEVDLPLCDPGAALGDVDDGPAAPLPAGAPVPGLRGPVGLAALVVDVPSILAERVVEHLQRAGAEVTFVHDAVQVVAALQAAAAGRRTFDVALVDVELPGDETEQVLEVLRSHGFGGTLVALSSFAQPELRAAFELRLGGEALIKPVPAETLFRVLAARLRTAGARGAEVAAQLDALARVGTSAAPGP